MKELIAEAPRQPRQPRFAEEKINLFHALMVQEKPHDG
jgi:hypothetical protein